MYHTSNIQNNIHDYQKLKNFNNIFWFEKAFLMYDMICVVNFSMLLDTHVIKTKNYFEKYMFVCIYEYTTPYI